MYHEHQAKLKTYLKKIIQHAKMLVFYFFYIVYDVQCTRDIFTIQMNF